MNLDNFPYFIFNGVKSTDLGIVIKELPPIIKAEKNIESITVSGSNRTLHIDNGTYKPKTYSVQCILTDLTKINQLKKLYDSTGVLELSTEPNIEYNATVKNQIDFSKYLTYLKEFVINFELDPVGFNKLSTTENFSQSSSFNVGGNIDVYPQIIVDGVGTFSLNNIQVQVLETGITIDCDLMNCVKNNINKNDKVILDKFPNLLVGENQLTIGNGISSISIVYKEGWI